MTLDSEAERAADALARAWDARSYSGWDPYDALSSPFLHRLARSRGLRIAAVQALKRCPVNLRPLLGVPRQAHTKALALFASAYALRAHTKERAEWYDERARRLADLLLARAREDGDGLAWSYDFDVQTRWSFYACGEPNAVATAFAAQALLDVAELGDGGHYRQAVDRAVSYSIRVLARERRGNRYFAYHRGSSAVIHNASLLIAALCLRASSSEGEAAVVARSAVDYAVRSQRGDGTWPYGEEPGLSWVDGFHTAYVLESLWSCTEHGQDEAARAAAERGLAVYLDRLVDPDGAARATIERRYPLDVHAAASGITMLSRLRGLNPRADEVAARMVAWTLARMRRRDGRFAYQQHRLYRNSLPYVRWNDGHMMLALSAYLTR
jgi:hypothetical protein